MTSNEMGRPARAKLSAVEDLLQRARAQRLDLALLRPLFERFLLLGSRFAELEKKVLGSVPLQFPAYLYETAASQTGDPIQDGVMLADRERERLDLGRGVVDDLERRLEIQGLKIVHLAFPSGCPLLGVFLFDAEIGPIILVNASCDRHERDYTLAHFYGHFLADNDPYHAWVCLMPGSSKPSPEEIRAQAFAGALLVAPADLDLYLRESGHRRGATIPAELFEQLRVYFDADDRALVGGLLSGGWLTAGDVAGLLAHSPGEGSGPVPADDEGGGADEAPADLPARYVNLALTAYRSGGLTLAETAAILEMDEPSVLALDALILPAKRKESDARRPA